MTTLTDAWQRALGAEEQAVFGYALAGPRLDAGTVLARTCQVAHEALRDQTESAIEKAGATPAPPPADFPSLYPVPDAGAARWLAIRLEQDSARAWRYLYAVAALGSGADAVAVRTAAQAALTASAVRATQWRLLVDRARATVAFPGI